MSKLGRRTRVVLGVSGSISAYKAAELARYFIKRGCVVRVVLSKSARRFITPLTFRALTHQPVLQSFWDEDQPGAIGHIALADWADVLVVAPASADLVAKAAFGFSDSPILAILLATKAPVVIAPAMNVNMYEHPQTQENLATLMARGVAVVEPQVGELACGWRGRGRLAPASEIYFSMRRSIGPRDLIGKRICISTGPTREAIDPVRFISNRSSGRMGIALAREAFFRGAEVTLIHGPLQNNFALPTQIKRIPVISADQMRGAVLEQRTIGTDVIVMAAAVSDYKASDQRSEKIKRSSSALTVNLAPNPDILRELGGPSAAAKRPFLVGFAVETGTQEALVAEAQRKLEVKGADLIVGNLADDAFDRGTNRVCLVSKGGEVVSLETAPKSAIAAKIFDKIVAGL